MQQYENPIEHACTMQSGQTLDGFRPVSFLLDTMDEARRRMSISDAVRLSAIGAVKLIFGLFHRVFQRHAGKVLGTQIPS